MTLDFSIVLSRWDMLLAGLGLTARLALITVFTGFCIGTLVAIARRSGTRLLSVAASTYVECIRNTPFIVQIFVIYFGLSSMGFSFSAIVVAVLALTINVGAYTAEIMRAGFDSIQKGQWEAGECLGLSPVQLYWHVGLRPAMERVYPALTSQFVLLMLASSVTSQISAEELTGAGNFIQSDTYRPFETYIVVALLYLGLSIIMRAGFWGLGMALFPRRRRLGTPL